MPPGFEPGIEVLQTFALPLGYGTIFNYSLKESDSKGIWTPVTAVKGRCLNRLTMEPDIFVLGSRSEKRTPPVGLEPTTLRLTAACSTDWAKEDYQKIYRIFKTTYMLTKQSIILTMLTLVKPSPY